MSRLSTRTRFALAAVLLIAPIIVIALIVLDQSFKRSQDQVITGEFATADVIAQSVSQLIQGQQDALTALAQEEAIRAIDQRTEEAFALMDAYRLSRPPVNGLFFLTNDLTPITQTVGIDPSALTSVPEFQAAAQAAVQGGQPTVSDPLGVPSSNVQVVAIIVPVYTTAEVNAEETPPLGAIGAFYSVERLLLGFQPPGGFSSGSDVAVGLVNSMGQVVPDPNRATDPTAVLKDGADLQAAIQSALAGQRAQASYHDPTGTDRALVAVPIPIPGNRWAVLVSSPESMEYGPIQTLVERAIIALIAAIVATIILAVFLGDWLARPFRQLAGQAHALSSGGAVAALESTGPSDAAELSRTIREMADRMRAQVRDTESAREEIARQAERLRDLLRRTVRLQEDERRRIASDIHDAVSPLITGALYQTQAVRLASSNGNGGHFTNGTHNDNGVPDGEGEAMTGLQEVSDLLERAMRELHDVIFDLRPPDLDDIGIVAALQRHVDQVNRTGLRTTLEVSGDEQRLPPEVRLAIYRIVQEALHNATRHARADDAVVRIEWVPEKLRVTVQDDGSGFDVENSGRPAGLGLMSMRERAWSIGAALDIVSRPGSGTAIVVERRTDELDLGSDVGSQDGADAVAASADADLDNALYDEVEYAGVDEEQRGS